MPLPIPYQITAAETAARSIDNATLIESSNPDREHANQSVIDPALVVDRAHPAGSRRGRGWKHRVADEAPTAFRNDFIKNAIDDVPLENLPCALWKIDKRGAVLPL